MSAEQPPKLRLRYAIGGAGPRLEPFSIEHDYFAPDRGAFMALFLPGKSTAASPNRRRPTVAAGGRQAMTATERAPLHHTQKMRRRLDETIEHLRADIDKVDGP